MKYPRGKVHPDDEGELEFKIAADQIKNVVVIQFPKPVFWLAMEPDLAKLLAEKILEKATELESTPGS
jgi:hypothetical protein